MRPHANHGHAVDRQDATLLAAAAGGDETAWVAIVDRYLGLVLAIVRGYELGPETTDDVVQTVWLRLAGHCGRIRQPERLHGWLAVTAGREALRASKLRAKQIPVERVFDGAADQPALDERLLDDELSAEVGAAFQQLDEPCRQLLRLLCAEPPLDYATVSRITGRPVGSLGPTRARCLAKLRALIESASEDGPPVNGDERGEDR